MRMNPASVVSLNSMMVTKSCIARKKNAKSVMIQASSKTTIVTKFVKNLTGPKSSPTSLSSGCAASYPVLAIKPGRRRSLAVIVEFVAFSPSWPKLSKMIVARLEKLLMISAKTPTYSTFLRNFPMTELSDPIAQ